jgi:hypothetical protein
MTMAATENADGGAARIGRYTAGAASHMFEEFLEYRLGHDAFWEWLMSYPPSNSPQADPAVEDEIDHAILALRAFQDGHRSWGDVHRELLDSRSRLTGLARF